ncbi:hypothetical protein AAMO2058_000428500 [Amorphochlora amoebiformis]|mmetsp:Transcript_22736/g.35725  ORF Transcript_22736/g.35725 Transcript_22736/m.35725 type:complete len:517 (-) Transcript_22736:38-1588(-)
MDFKCKICDIKMGSAKAFEEHNRGRKHKQKEFEAKRISIPSNLNKKKSLLLHLLSQYGTPNSDQHILIQRLLWGPSPENPPKSTQTVIQMNKCQTNPSTQLVTQTGHNSQPKPSQSNPSLPSTPPLHPSVPKCMRKEGKGEGKHVLLFYKYADISDPAGAVVWQDALCRTLEITGRIRIASEGINGTVAGSIEALEVYKRAMFNHKELQMDPESFKVSAGSSVDFPSLEVRECQEIVALGIPPSLLPAKAGGRHVTPEEFHRMISKWSMDAIEESPGVSGKYQGVTGASETGDLPKAIIVDCRNEYEWKVGRFNGAILPHTRQFSDWPKFADELIKRYQLAPQSLSTTTPASNGKEDEKKGNPLGPETPVLMYCTGGIRCERGSAYLRSKGVKNVFQLQGGIHRYLERFPDGGGFKGKLFVFDKRRVIQASKAEVIGTCDRCAKPYDQYDDKIRCKSCRALALVCPSCQKDLMPETSQPKKVEICDNDKKGSSAKRRDRRLGLGVEFVCSPCRYGK